jgi:hypothetical protein
MLISKFFAADLTPGSGGTAKIDNSLGFFEDLKQVVDLE